MSLMDDPSLYAATPSLYDVLKKEKEDKEFDLYVAGTEYLKYQEHLRNRFIIAIIALVIFFVVRENIILICVAGLGIAVILSFISISMKRKDILRLDAEIEEIERKLSMY